MSVKGEKGGGGLGKKVNSELREIKWVREREKNGFCSNCCNWFGNKAKRSGSGLSTSPLSCLIKINSLGRNHQSARAVSVNKLSFRPTLTDEWEVFRSPN